MNNIILKVQGSEINSIINNQITVGEIVKVTDLLIANINANFP